MPGSGTTCVSLALSNFLRNKLGRRTAYVELNTTNEIRCLSLDPKAINFTHYGVDIFPCQNITSLPEVLRMDYEYFILDMGVLNTYTAKEYSMCDKQFLVCSLSKWNKQKIIEKIEQLLNTTYIQPKQLTILENLSIEESKLSIFSKVRLQVYSIPFITNPFQLETRLFHDFTKILKGV